MIEVHYIGRLGNKLFQYCFGRILAESFGWQLTCRSIPAFPRTAERVVGQCFNAPEVRYDRRAIVDVPMILENRTPRKILVKAWMQRYEYYRPHAAQIRYWLKPRAAPIGTFPVAEPDDLVLHCRLGADYEDRRWIVHPEFYQNILRGCKPWKKLYICYDVRERVRKKIFDECLAPLLSFEPIFFASGKPLVDFNFVRQFRRIAIAPSTFCWWAAYLSEADEIYFPDLRDSSTSCWRARRDQFISLEVDEYRYRYIKARTLWD